MNIHTGSQPDVGAVLNRFDRGGRADLLQKIDIPGAGQKGCNRPGGAGLRQADTGRAVGGLCRRDAVVGHVADTAGALRNGGAVPLQQIDDLFIGQLVEEGVHQIGVLLHVGKQDGLSGGGCVGREHLCGGADLGQGEIVQVAEAVRYHAEGGLSGREGNGNRVGVDEVVPLVIAGSRVGGG